MAVSCDEITGVIYGMQVLKEQKAITGFTNGERVQGYRLFYQDRLFEAFTCLSPKTKTVWKQSR